MRHYLKTLLISAAAFYLAFTLIPTISVGSDFRNFFLIIGGLWFIAQIINPVFSLILLPINLLTFGVVSLILNIAFVFALLNFLKGFDISAYNFPGASVEGIILPPIKFNEIATIILAAVIITFAQRILHLIFD